MNIENCPEGEREVIAKIEKLTTEYMEAIQKLGVSDPIKTAQQAVKKNLPSSKNKFWRDIADIAALVDDVDHRDRHGEHGLRGAGHHLEHLLP